MKRLITFLIGIPFTLFSQNLSNAGRIIQPGIQEAIQYKSGEQTGRINSFPELKLKGNTAFISEASIVTLDANYENAPSTLRHYSKSGELLFEKEFRQTINFKLNRKGTACCWYDLKNIQVLNLLTHTQESFPGSTVFNLDENGNILFYSEETSTVYYKSLSELIHEPVYYCLTHKNKALFATRQSLMILENSGSTKLFSSKEGRIFDIYSSNETLYICIKTETPEHFVFTLLESTDLQTYSEKETKLYPRKSSLQKKTEKKTSAKQLNNETFPDPLYYNADTVYHEVGNSYNEMQEYSPGQIYPHPGVDLFGYDQQPVYSVKKGYVKSILTTSGAWHWRIAIANNNTSGYSQGYLYAHLEQSSFPFAVGDSVNAGDQIGVLVNFPVTGFVHCHFARVGCTGSVWNANWWTFDNPLCYMDNFFDSIPPTFEKTINNDAFAFRNSTGSYLMPDSLYGNVKVISKIHDRINSTLWNSDVHKIRYQISPLASPATLLLDSSSFEYHYYNDFYYSGPTYLNLLDAIYSRDAQCFSTGNYNQRDFYHIVTNTNGDDTLTLIDQNQFFNTNSLANGNYIFRILAWDAANNMSKDSMIIKIRNFPNGIEQQNTDDDFKIYPNPTNAYCIVHLPQSASMTEVKIVDLQGRIVWKQQVSEINNVVINTSDLAEGIYLLQITSEKGYLLKRKLIKQ